MPFERKQSQPRKTQLLTSLPPLPASAPPELRAWYDAFKGAVDEDRETLEQAIAELRKDIAQLTPATIFAALVERVDALAAGDDLIRNENVAADAAIRESKLQLNFATHSNANDPTADQKAALAGTSGTPSDTNRYVTDEDERLESLSDLNVNDLIAHHGHGALKQEIEAVRILALI